MLLEGMHLGRYHLSRLLGSGGMGEVYLGEDMHIRRQVAVKVTRKSGRSENALKQISGSLFFA